jgi:hypothetical protein
MVVHGYRQAWHPDAAISGLYREPAFVVRV